MSAPIGKSLILGVHQTGIRPSKPRVAGSRPAGRTNKTGPISHIQADSGTTTPAQPSRSFPNLSALFRSPSSQNVVPRFFLRPCVRALYIVRMPDDVLTELRIRDFPRDLRAALTFKADMQGKDLRTYVIELARADVADILKAFKKEGTR